MCVGGGMRSNPCTSHNEGFQKNEYFGSVNINLSLLVGLRATKAQPRQSLSAHRWREVR